MGELTEQLRLEGWFEYYSERKKRPYYYNKFTKKTQFEFPVEGSVGGGVEDSSVPVARGGGGGKVVEEVGAAEVAGDARAAQVASAYARPEQGLAAREESELRYFRRFQNWVKSVLINVYAPTPSSRVLDLACGRLGDLSKWVSRTVRDYVGVDISRTQVELAAERFNGSDSGGKMRARLAVADLGVVNLNGTPLLEPDETFDAISIQFALHYLFRSESTAIRFFQNIANRLRPGGVFLGTVPDADVLVRMIRDAHAMHMRKGAAADPEERSPLTKEGAEDSFLEDNRGDDNRTGLSKERLVPVQDDGITPGVSFGNKHVRIHVPAETVARVNCIGDAPFGLAYKFWLQEAVESASQETEGVEEYLVPWPLLVRLAKSVGLEPIEDGNFHDFFYRMAQGQSATELLPEKGIGTLWGSKPPDRREETHLIHQNAALLRHLRVMDENGTLGDDEWFVSGLYRCFAFRRVAALPITLPLPKEPEHPKKVVPFRPAISKENILRVAPDHTTKGGGPFDPIQTVRDELREAAFTPAAKPTPALTTSIESAYDAPPSKPLSGFVPSKPSFAPEHPPENPSFPQNPSFAAAAASDNPTFPENPTFTPTEVPSFATEPPKKPSDAAAEPDEEEELFKYGSDEEEDDE